MAMFNVVCRTKRVTFGLEPQKMGFINMTGNRLVNF